MNEGKNTSRASRAVHWLVAAPLLVVAVVAALF